MPLSIHERHLADRYLSGELSGIELEEFNAKLENDSGFKESVELQKLIYSGIAHAREEELKKMIRSSISYRKSSVPFGLKLILTFLVILVLGITFWSYLGNEFEKLKPYDNFISLFKNQQKTDTVAKKKSMNTVKTEQIPEASFQNQDTVVSDTSGIKSDSAEAANAASNEDIEVKKDVMVASVSVPVIDKTREKDESLSKDVAQKLPDADLPQDERVDTFIVEFWASPVHYKGYKMSKNKIVVFGLENIEDVKLYRVTNSIFMRYDEVWYAMAYTYDFTPYQKLKDTEVPAELK
jgi:hypothetical protein